MNSDTFRKADKGRKWEGVGVTAEFDTVCCLSLPELIMDMGLRKRPAGRIRILLEHFRIILK